MNTLIFLGPPGSGKTTLIGTLLSQGALSGKTAFVFNDDGTENTVDAAIISGGTDFRALTNGCFGCRDERSLHELLAELRRTKYDSCIIEPLGFIAGSELPSLLIRQGLSPRIITLVDALHHADNLVLGCVESQLAAANTAIVVTKGGETPEEKLLDYIAEHARPVPVLCWQKGHPLPAALTETLRTQKRRLVVRQAACSHGCSHDHGHDHHDHADDAHSHGVWTYHYRLDDSFTLTDIRALFADKPSVFRIKGVAGGRQFHRVQQGEWEVTIADTSPPFVTFYSREPVESTAFTALSMPIQHDDSTRSLLRRTDIDAGETAALLERLMSQVPRKPVIGRYGPLTNPEVLEIINEVRKRPGVPAELAARAIEQRVSYYLDVLDLMTPDSPWWSDTASADRKRMLAVGIGWFAKNRPDALSPRTRERVAGADLDSLLADGLQGMTSHNSDQTRAIDTAQEVAETVSFIGKPSERLLTALHHALRLAEDSPESNEAVATAWKRAYLMAHQSA